MAKKKCYAVKVGKQTGIFYSWPECEAAVKGYPGAQYKGFTSEDDAKAYLGGGNDKEQNTEPESKMDETIENSTKMNFERDRAALAYVDGSYNDELGMYGSGIVLIIDGNETEISKSGNDDAMLAMWNVAGEVVASMIAIEEAIKLGCKKLTIYYDYNGIAGWAEGCYINGKKTKIWTAYEEGSKRYKEFIVEAKKQIELNFVKVKAHSGDKYNNKADKLAKYACGIS